MNPREIELRDIADVYKIAQFATQIKSNPTPEPVKGGETTAAIQDVREE
jgi:hypothetical protein